MEHRILNPVNVGASRTRRAAWMSCKAAMVAFQTKALSGSQTFSKAFKKALEERCGGKLRYFVYNVRPNRGEVQLKTLDGEGSWYNLVNGKDSLPKNLESIFEINPEYELYHKRQKELLSRQKMGLTLKFGYDSLPYDLWADDFLEFERGFAEQDIPPRWAHYVDVYNDLAGEVDHEALSGSGRIVTLIYLTAQLHWLDDICVKFYTDWMMFADSRMSRDDCFTLMALALGYETANEAMEQRIINGRIINKHFLENSDE